MAPSTADYLERRETKVGTAMIDDTVNEIEDGCATDAASSPPAERERRQPAANRIAVRSDGHANTRIRLRTGGVSATTTGRQRQ